MASEGNWILKKSSYLGSAADPVALQTGPAIMLDEA